MTPRVLLVLTLVLPAADDAPAPASGRTDLERFQGAWTMGSLETDGVQTPEERARTWRLKIEEDRYEVTAGERRWAFTFRIDPTKDPKTIDLTLRDGPLRGRTFRGIYSLDGDTFMLCRSRSMVGPRPDDFATRTNSERLLVVWKRRKT